MAHHVTPSRHERDPEHNPRHHSRNQPHLPRASRSNALIPNSAPEKNKKTQTLLENFTLQKSEPTTPTTVTNASLFKLLPLRISAILLSPPNLPLISSKTRLLHAVVTKKSMIYAMGNINAIGNFLLKRASRVLCVCGER